MRSRLILAFTAVVLLAATALQVADLQWRRRLTLQATEARVTAQGRALAVHVNGAFAAADSSLRQLAIYSKRIGGPAAPSTEWLPILEAARAALAEEGSLSVTDAQGVIRHSTLPSIVGQSRAGNYLFEHLRNTQSDQLAVDAPFESPVRAGRWVLPVGRRLEDDRGRFEGLAVQVVTPETFRHFFQTLRIGTEGVIWVFHPTGAILFREPSVAEPLGERATGNRLFETARREGGAGLVTGPLIDGGATYISSYRTLDLSQLVVAVSLSEHEILAEWRDQRRRAVRDLLVLAGVVAVLLVFVARQVRARSQAERILGQLQQTEADRLREANDRLQEALVRERRAREQTEAASRLKDEFLMTLSHELRTPMNAILGWVHMLTTEAVPPEKRTDALTIVERNATVQSRLIEDLLDVSRAISGKLHVAPRPVNVGDVVGAAVDTLRPAINAKDLRFSLQVDEGIGPIQADPERLQQIVWNLLSNSIKFTPPGGSVHLAVSRTGGNVEIVLRDNGSGIAPAFLPYVFDRFRQADAGPRREQGGLGLGLAIARHLVELHGGTITAESEGPGRGATFRVVLPHLPQSSPPVVQS